MSHPVTSNESAGGSRGVSLKFDAAGLVTVVAQDYLTGEVRMVAHANREAIARTFETGKATFFSRSRQALWEKGELSGNSLRVVRVLVDCDADCVVYAVEPSGPSCHTGAATCFFRVLEPAERSRAHDSGESWAATPTEWGQTLALRLERELEARKASSAATSYTKSLYDGGAARIGAKLSEEAGELALALANESDERVASEAADVLYHLVVGLRFRGVPLREVLAALERRTGTSGHAEKASRVAETPSSDAGDASGQT